MTDPHETPAPAEGYKHFWRGGEEPTRPPGEGGADAAASAYERFMAAIED